MYEDKGVVKRDALKKGLLCTIPVLVCLHRRKLLTANLLSVLTKTLRKMEPVWEKVHRRKFALMHSLLQLLQCCSSTHKKGLILFHSTRSA